MHKPVKYLEWLLVQVAKVGWIGYAAITRRNLTERLGLPSGPNALWPTGLLLPLSVR